MKTIKCHCGESILLDDEDYEKYKHWSFWCNGGTMVVTKIRNSPINIAHFLIEVPEGFYPDHVDRNRHNNQKSNLRIVTKMQNVWNSKRKDNKLGLKGIIFRPETEKYRVRITANGIRYELGQYKTKEEAVKIYNEAALKHHGEFAVLNSI